VLLGKVFREEPFSLAALAFTAASAALSLAVTDVPETVRAAVVEASSFGWTRHFSLIRLMAASVV
jgi:hypothetical protein